MGDYSQFFPPAPNYKYDPQNYEPNSGPAFAGAPQAAEQFSAVPPQQQPAPLANYGEAPAPAFTIDTTAPVQRPPQQSIGDAYTRTFGHSPESASVAIEPIAPAARTTPAQQPIDQGLSLDDALTVAGASQGGMYQDPRAVQRVRELQAERQGMYEHQAQSVEKNATETAAVQEEIAKKLEQKSRWADEWASGEAKRQADRAERGKQLQADIQAKQQQATEAASNLDGNRLMHGGGGVLMAIGMALGAFGASINKMPNFALTIVQNALDRDLESQKENVRGKQQAVSFARDIYQGFRDAGHDELESKMATRAVVYEAFATKIDAMAAQSGAGERRAKGEEMAREVRLGANQEALGSAQLAARPKGTKALTPQQVAENALKLQGQSLDNATKANKLAEGGDNKAGGAPVESIQKSIESLRGMSALNQDAKDWQRQGYSNLPAAGGIQDIPHDVVKGVKKVFGGSGETPLETRLRVGPMVVGNSIFRANTGQAANTENERKDVLALGQGNGTTSGFIELTEREHAKQVSDIQSRIDQLPKSSRERAVAQQQLDAEKAKISANPDRYREKFGSH